MAKGGAPRSGWYRDPTGRHELRRWDGDGWSEWVMDGGRRHFDDIDGCGGPPVGERVAVIDGPGRGRARGGRGRGPASAGASDAMLPAPEAASSALVPALGVAVVAGLAAGVVVALGEAAAFPAGLPGAGDDTVRLYLLPIVVATAAFHAVLALGLLLLRSRGAAAAAPWRRIAGIGRDELLRGVVAFLLALFARTFLVSLLAGPFAGAVRPIGPWVLFAAEAVLLLAIAPIVEEVVFRGALFTGLRHRTRPWVAVVGQAAVYGAAFAWAGVGTSRFAAGVGAFAVGAVFGWFTHTTNDLRPVVVGHLLLNGWFVAERLLAA